MQLFQTRKGKTLLGLLVLSGGGMIITQLQQKISNPQILQYLGFLLVFWVIFTARLTYVYAWQRHEDPKSQEVAPVKTPSGKAAKKGSSKASADEDDSNGDDGKPRRRRTRRD